MKSIRNLAARLLGHRDAAGGRAELLFPVIVPKSYFQYGNWPGPFRLLKHPELALVWVTLEKRQTMLYVNHEQAKLFESLGIDYHQRAMANLGSVSSNWAGTHEKKAIDGSIEYIAMMQADGLGSSRLLLSERIRSVFPEGYNVAIPERSVGIAMSKQLEGESLLNVGNLVQQCCKNGTVPMLDGIYQPEDFALA